MSQKQRWQIVFWEPMISPHKAYLCNALAESPDVSGITYVAQSDVTVYTSIMGWSIDELNAKLVLTPNRRQVCDIIEGSGEDAIHIFSGIHWVPAITEGIAAAIAHGRHFGIMSEPRAFEGVKGLARYAHSLLTERSVRAHADFVLAIGRNGPPWFRSVGYEGQRIFPFAYFLPEISAATNRLGGNGAPVVSFLGRLTQPKGILIFLNSLSFIRHQIRVEVAGGGPEEAAVRDACHSMAIPITFRGAIPMKDVPDFMRFTDILVVPSTTKDDGWGAVISEALLAGACVVASGRVGGSICLDADWRGWVIDRLDPITVALAVDRLIDRGSLNEAGRDRRAAWANARLTGHAGARYLLAIFSHIYEGKARPAPFYADCDPENCAIAEDCSP